MILVIFVFTFLIIVPQLEDKKVFDSETNEEMCELVLDGGFVLPKEISDNNGCVKPELLVSNDEFIAPDINAFGQTFRFGFV